MHALQRIERAVKHEIKGLQGCAGQLRIIIKILLKSAGDFLYFQWQLQPLVFPSVSPEFSWVHWAWTPTEGPSPWVHSALIRLISEI